MKNYSIFSRQRMSLAVMLALATSAGLQLAHAGAGWGDSEDMGGTPIKTPTYYANSPSGLLPAEDCFITQPSISGAFSTTNPVLTADIASGIPTEETSETPGVCDTGKALRKFVDTLPGLGIANKNNLDNYIPVAVADTTTYPGSDYYEIAVVEYTQQMHSDLKKPTTLRGYVQISASGTVALNTNLPNGSPAMAVAKPSYLGPIISSTTGRPTRIKFYNLLPAGSAGNLHIPVDETITGAGTGPDGTKYQQNRVEIHLHGGDNPWISDGTPHQWILPAADEIALKASGHPDMARGVGAKNVPDMPDPGPGAMTYYFPNGQGGRLMFYHDHAIGLTRLNVYAGVVAGYLLNDLPGVGEKHPELAALLPPATEQIPLIIQDKTFVPKNIASQDAKWKPEMGTEGDLWYPHVYETNQDPNSVDATNPVGRWDWGPWFWPVFPSTYDLPTGEINVLNPITGLSEVSTTPEAFMDTPLVNGTAYPKLEVDPKAYRFRILNGANDRFLNLGLYLAADKKTTDASTPTDSTHTVLCDGATTRPDGTPLNTSDCTEVKMVNFDVSYTPPNAPYTPDGTIGFPTAGGITDTGWGQQVGGMFPQGAPDPATAGPHIVQIGNEAGLIANPLDIPSTPLNYEYNKRSVTVLGVQEHGLYLGNAERADVLIDFSQYAGKTLILYNDAPAPVPASDPRVDYFTGNGDFTGAGGAPNVKPGYGPNTRTIMQIVVKSGTPQPGPTIAQLKTALPKAYATTQAMPVVPEPEFNAAFSSDPVYSTILPTARNNARIYTGSIYLNSLQGMSFKTPEPIKYFPSPTCNSIATCNAAIALQKTQPNNGLVGAPAGSSVNVYVENKAIQELFDPNYGRMNATLGVELPFTSAVTQTTIPLGYVDPATETVADGETQFWKITHNGVDTHPVHFHLVNVQVINRIGWDGTIKVPAGDEIGWKETVKMSPLEDVVVAVRAKKPTIQGVTTVDGTEIPSNAFGLPISSRLMDPSQAAGSALGFTQVNPADGTPAVVKNAVKDFGWEYVWHCHILGHEENDFMRPVVFNANEATAVAPSNLTLAGNVLSWTDAATTEYAYKVERATVGTGGVGAYTDLTATVTPEAQKTGEAPLANATTFIDTTAVTSGASAVTAPALNAPAATATSVTLSWSAVVQAASYTIERAPGSNATTGFTTVGTSTTASFTDSNLSPTTAYSYRVIALAANSYSYRVTAVAANGNASATVATPDGSAASAVVSVTTQVLPATNLVAVTDLAAQVNATNVMQLNWTDASIMETGYSIQRCTGNITTTCAATGAGWASVTGGITPTGALTSTTNGSITATITANITQNNTVNYRVYPLDGATVGPVSNTVSVNMGVNPTAPTNVTAPATATVAGGVSLSWQDVANNNTEYRFRSRYATAFRANGTVRSWSGWANVTVSPAIGGNATAATLTAAQIGTTYQAGRTFQFQVGARNARNTSYTTSSNVVVQ